MNILKRELKRNWKACAIWTAVFILYDALIFGMLPVMREQAESYRLMLESMPKELLAAFNIGSMNFNDTMESFGTYCSVYFVMAGSIYATLLGAGILSKEEGGRTAEFLLARPVTRTQVALEKFAAAAVLVLSFVTIYAGVSAIFMWAADKAALTLSRFFLIWSGYALSLLVFLCAGFLSSIFSVRPRTLMPLAMSLGFGTYMIGMVSRMRQGLGWLEWFSPMDWFGTNRCLAAGGLPPGYAVAALLLISALPAIAVYLFNKKDIKA